MSILELGKTASFYGGKWTIPFRPKRANSVPFFEKKPKPEKKKRKNIFRALIKDPFQPMIYPPHREVTNDMFLTVKAKSFNMNFSRKSSKRADRNSNKTVDRGLEKVIGVIGYKRGRSFGLESGAVSGVAGSTLHSGSKGKLASDKASVRNAAHLTAAAAEEEEDEEGSDSDGGGGAEATQEGDLFVEMNAANEFEDDDDDGGDDDDDEEAIDAMVAEIENDVAMLGNNEFGFI